MKQIPEVVEALLARRDTRIAVVGASNDPTKYGNIIVKNLMGKGYSVIPINPRERFIEGLPVFKDVASASGPIHIVNFVTPPAVTRSVLEGLAPSSIEVVWFQDGSADDEVLAYAESRFKVVVHHACIMVVSARYAHLT